MLVGSVLLGGPAPQHLHGFGGHPVVLEQIGPQVVLPLAGQAQPLVQHPAHAVPLGQLHQVAATAQATEQEDLHIERGPPHIHRPVDHEGAVRHEQHRRAFETGMQHEVQQLLHAPLHRLAGAKTVVAAALDIQPAQDRPPEGGIHGGDAPDRTLAVVGHQLALLLHEAGREDPPGLVGAALQLQADLQEMPHDPEAPLQQQVDHHWHVVAQEDLAVVGFTTPSRVRQGGHRPHHGAPRLHEGAFEQVPG